MHRGLTPSRRALIAGLAVAASCAACAGPAAAGPGAQQAVPVAVGTPTPGVTPTSGVYRGPVRKTSQVHGLTISPLTDSRVTVVDVATIAAKACRSRPKDCVPPDIVLGTVTTRQGMIQPDNSVIPFLDHTPGYLALWYDVPCLTDGGMPDFSTTTRPRAPLPTSCSRMMVFDAATGDAFFDSYEDGPHTDRPWT
jgi:hypothetical protein